MILKRTLKEIQRVLKAAMTTGLRMTEGLAGMRFRGTQERRNTMKIGHVKRETVFRKERERRESNGMG